LLQLILEYEIPMREELEIMLVKVALKPALTLAKKLNMQPGDLSRSDSSAGSKV
jgi:hypothetical protein